MKVRLYDIEWDMEDMDEDERDCLPREVTFTVPDGSDEIEWVGRLTETYGASIYGVRSEKVE